MICATIIAKNKDKAIREMLEVRTKADIVELRLDYFENNLDKIHEDIKEIISKKRKPVIFTCRPKSEGGVFLGTEQDRKEILEYCIESKADYVDVELSAGFARDLLNDRKETQIILSYHNFSEIPENIEKIYDEMKDQNADIIKIACMANSLSDNLRIFELLKKSKQENIRLIAHCMGERGKISRILNLMNGSYLTYGYIEKQAAPGQISCEHLKRVYRVDKLNEETKIYGLIGNPVSESKGFIVHNLSFKELNINSVYVNFLVNDLDEFFRDYKGFFSGLSVTMPFKESVIEYLDEIDEAVKKIGAVNTIEMKDGKLIGYNTDCSGAIDAIKEKTEIQNKTVLMIGAGGAAKAIGYGIVSEGGRLIIANRSKNKAIELAAKSNCDFVDLDSIDWSKIDILINASSVGMMPNIDESPVQTDSIRNIIVFDAIYNPLITKLIHDCQSKGCVTIGGIKMFVNQAREQFHLWTGLEIDKHFVEDTILQYVVE